MDSVMLGKNMLEENDDLRMVGRDIRSAFNGLRGDITAEIVENTVHFCNGLPCFVPIPICLPLHL